jgi:hypothetical protein
VRNYTLLCLAALLSITLVLVQREAGWLALLPLLAGSVAVAASWSIGVPLVLLCVAGILVVRTEMVQGRTLGGSPESFVANLILCGALLAYAAGQYRLQALLGAIFPPDGRRASRRRPTSLRLPPPEQPRDPDLVGQGELTQVLVGVLVFCGLASVAWVRLRRSWPPLGIGPREWQGLVIVWAGGTVLAAAGTVSAYLRLRRSTPGEAVLYLQDTLWRQTRREQSRLNRWLVWARLRRLRKLHRRGRKA